MTITAADNYAGIIAQRVLADREGLSQRWLDRLKQILTVDAHEVFPSTQLLDHIPSLITEVAWYLAAPEQEEIAANAAVIDKARELGVLRHQQQASVHQVLREYAILSELLEALVVEETARLALSPSPVECFDVLRRLTRATHTLMHTTVETFISEYTATIQERNERLRHFNRMASHELRSPIATLMFAAALLNTDSVRTDPGRLTKVGAIVHANTQRLSWLIENLQRMARIGTADDTPSEQQLEAANVAAEVARQLGEMATSRGVTIRVADGLPTLYADPARLELILLNLVSNAIKYSDPDKPDRFVEIGADDAEDGTRTIWVRDNGIGIKEADQPAVFQRFFRAHAELDARLGVDGTGLGLAIAVDCAQALGGRLRCESTVGVGTTFFLTLPINQNADPPLPSPQGSPAA